MYRITIERLANGDGTDNVKLYEQTVDSDELNLLPLISAINRRPRKSRAKQPGSAGEQRK